MSAYAIAELAEGEAGGYRPRGALKTLWQSRDFECMVAGPAETGKTWGCLQYVDALLWRYPGAQGVMLRKTYSALVTSALRTYLRILGRETPVRPYGGEKPEWFQYPNGSRLWVAGLDNPAKALSTERDFIYANQAEELSLEDWQVLTTRCTGRGAVMPYTRIFGDCNPGPPTHWIKQRPQLRILESRHEDNPTLYTEAGELTAQGRVTLGILDSLTGVRRERLRFGRWVKAEGVVYEEWDPAFHVLPALPRGSQGWRRARAVDFGLINPFVCLWGAIDPDERIYVYRELYRTGRIVADHATQINEQSEGARFEVTICDHDAEDRLTLERAGIPTQPAYKAIRRGIEAVQARLRKQADGRPRLFFVEGALIERDESLVKARKPWSTPQEMDVYSWPQGEDGRPLKEVPTDLDNHGADALRYLVGYVDRLAEEKPGKTPAVNPLAVSGGGVYSPGRRAAPARGPFGR